MTSSPSEPTNPNSPTRWATMVRRHYETWLPGRVAEIPEDQRASFYSTLGEQIADQIESLEMDLRGAAPPGETFMARVGRFRMARMRAEERALAEMLPAPEEEEDQPVTPVMDDLEIILLHGLDPETEDPDDRLSQQGQLEDWRQHYRRLGRRPGLD